LSESRQASTSSPSTTEAVGAMSKEDRSVLAKNSPYVSWNRDGEKKIGSQPSAISAVRATFLGPMAAR
jgi:hypothetical protein